MEKSTHPVRPLPRGTRIGPYTIVRQMPGGVGGMAVVYEARLGRRGSTVALKVAHEGLAGFLKDEAAFLKALDLHHPHIIRILPTPLVNGTSDFIVRDPQTGYWYFAMEFMAGGSLEDWLRQRQQLSHAEAVELLRQVGSALDAAHQAGIVHLDVNPSNILFRRKPRRGFRAVLTDFGIARPRGRVSSGQTTLTVEYASPEQVRLAGGEPTAIGPASDLYSLAVVFCEAIGGHPPFQAADDTALAYQIIHEAPSLSGPSFPPQLLPFLERALAKEPARRYPSAAAMLGDLEKLLPALPRARARNRRWRPLALLGVGLLVGLALGVAVGAYGLSVRERIPAATVAASATPTLPQSLGLTRVPTEALSSPTAAPTRRSPTSTPVPTAQSPALSPISTPAPPR